MPVAPKDIPNLHALQCFTLTHVMLQYTVSQSTLCFVTAVHANRTQHRQAERPEAENPTLMITSNEKYYAMNMCLYTTCTVGEMYGMSNKLVQKHCLQLQHTWPMT